MKIKALKCLICDSIIYSRARHDFRSCECENLFVDGGFAYQRAGAKDPEKMASVEIEVNATTEELYDDWNMVYDKFGLVKGD